MTAAGFTLIEVLVVLVVIAIVWISVMPMIQPDQQRIAREWLMQAKGLLSLSCDLSAQQQTSYRVVSQPALTLQRWDRHNQTWLTEATIPTLSVPHDWQLQAKRQPSPIKDEPHAWICRPDGDQQAGEIQLSKSTLAAMKLSWQGDGHYVLP